MAEMETTGEMEAEGGVPECLCSFVDTGSVDSHRFFLARRTLLEMLRDRGFPVADDELGLTLSAFRARFGENPNLDDLRINLAIHSSTPKKVIVIFCGRDPFKLSTVREIFAFVSKESLSNLILVLQNKITSKARGAIKEIFKFKVEIFQITELLVNVTKHVLKPRHDLLTEEEKQRLLEKYNVEEGQLPRMLQSDAIARYYGLEKGQIVKITYDRELTAGHVTYRCIM